MGEARRRKLKNSNYGKVPKTLNLPVKNKAPFVILAGKIYNTVEGRLEEIPARFQEDPIECIALFCEFCIQAFNKIMQKLDQNDPEAIILPEHVDLFIEKFTEAGQSYLQDYSTKEKEYLITGLIGEEWIDSYQLIDVVSSQNNSNTAKFIEKNRSTLFPGWIHYQAFKPCLPEEHLEYQAFWSAIGRFLNN